jgi:hypothetical protein
MGSVLMAFNGFRSHAFDADTHINKSKRAMSASAWPNAKGQR